MRKRSRSLNNADTFSIWTSFTDLMSNAFMVITLLLLLVIAKAIPSLSASSPVTPDEAPPIIVLPADKYQFESGSAVLPKNLKEQISYNKQDGSIIKAIETALKQYPRIDVVEVIGHTDGQPIGNQVSDLDKKLEKVANNQLNIKELHPGSNTDLGLMRALAVVKELQAVQGHKQEGRFKNLKFRPYSAAQLLLPNNGSFAKPEDRRDNKERRRIEIRFTQLGKEIKR